MKRRISQISYFGLTILTLVLIFRLCDHQSFFCLFPVISIDRYEFVKHILKRSII